MKSFIIALSLLSVSAFAQVPHNAECIMKKGDVSCSAGLGYDNGEWDAGVGASCTQPVSFRLSDGTISRTTISGSYDTTSSFEVDLLTLGLNGVIMKTKATSAAKKAIKSQLELFEKCSRYDRR